MGDPVFAAGFFAVVAVFVGVFFAGVAFLATPAGRLEPFPKNGCPLGRAANQRTKTTVSVARKARRIQGKLEAIGRTTLKTMARRPCESPESRTKRVAMPTAKATRGG